MENKLIKWNDIDFSKVSELLMFIIYKAGGEHGLSDTGIQKIAYYLKENTDYEFNSHLPFYWYYFGPYSEVISKTLELLEKENKIIRKQIDENYSVWYIKHPEDYNPPNDPIFQQFSNIFLTNNIGPFTTKRLTYQIYKRFAPRIFRLHFFVFKENFKHLYATLSRFQINQETFFLRNKPNIFKLIYTSESVLPKNKLFSDYNVLFSDYVSIIDYFLSNNKFEIIFDHLNDTIELTEDVWKNFGEGERILSHDSFNSYEDKIERWESLYYSHLDMLKLRLNSFENHVESITNFDNKNIIFNKDEQNLLKTILP